MANPIKQMTKNPAGYCLDVPAPRASEQKKYENEFSENSVQSIKSNDIMTILWEKIITFSNILRCFFLYGSIEY